VRLAAAVAHHRAGVGYGVMLAGSIGLYAAQDRQPAARDLAGMLNAPPLR
jgi:hypothetical protein